MDLTLLSLSIKVLEFELQFSLSLSHEDPADSDATTKAAIMI